MLDNPLVSFCIYVKLQLHFVAWILVYLNLISSVGPFITWVPISNGGFIRLVKSIHDDGYLYIILFCWLINQPNNVILNQK